MVGSNALTDSPAAPPTRRINPQNQENDFSRNSPPDMGTNPGLYPTPGVNPDQGGTGVSPHPNSMNNSPATYGSPSEIPRNVRPGAVPRRRIASAAPSGSFDLPTGGSLDAPTTPNTSYELVKSPTGQTVYFTDMGAAQAYAQSFASQTSGAAQGPQQIVALGGRSGRGGYTYVNTPPDVIQQGAKGAYGLFETGVTDTILAAGAAGRGVGSYIATGKFTSPAASLAQYKSQNVGFGITGAEFAAAGANIIAYTTPGVPIVKGIGEGGYQGAFDVTVGVLGVAPIVGSAAGVLKAGSYGADVLKTLGSPLVRTGLGAGVSAVGTAVAGGNIGQIAEAGLLGGAVSYVLPEGVRGLPGVKASAEAGQIAFNEADIFHTYDYPGMQTNLAMGEGPSYGQRLAMLITGKSSFVTGGYLTEVPVGGVETLESGAPIQGTASDLSGSLYKYNLLSESGSDFSMLEGRVPTEPPSGSLAPSKSAAGPAPVNDMPYSQPRYRLSYQSTERTITPPEPGTSVTKTPYDYNYQFQKSISKGNIGPAGGRNDFGSPSPGGRGGASILDQVYPRGVTSAQDFIRSQDYLTTVRSVTEPGFNFAVTTPLSISGAKVKPRGPLIIQPVVNQGITSGLGLGLAQGSVLLLGQGQTSGPTVSSAVSQVPGTVTSSDVISIQSLGTAQTFASPPTTRSGSDFTGFFPVAILPFGSGRTGAKTRKRYRFGEKVNLVQTVFLGEFGGRHIREKRRTKRRRK